jgi:hypothetical protein
MRTRAEIEAAIEETRITQAHYERDVNEALRGAEKAQEERVRLEQELATLPDPGTEYVNSLRDFVAENDTRLSIRTVAGECTVNAIQWGAIDSDAEVFVEVDRALLRDTIEASGGDPDRVWGGPLWTSLWVAVISRDEDGDVSLFVTSGERAQFGKDNALGFAPGVTKGA